VYDPALMHRYLAMGFRLALAGQRPDLPARRRQGARRRGARDESRLTVAKAGAR
jgi:hypothetical protein